MTEIKFETHGDEVDTAAIRSHLENSLRTHLDEGRVGDFSVGRAATDHARKDWKGRLKDWCWWKTPLRRWARRPYMVKVSLSEVLEREWDRGAFEELNLNDSEFEMLSRGAEGLFVWEQKYPDNPYEVVVVDYSIRPVKPAEYIQLKIGPIGEECRK